MRKFQIFITIVLVSIALVECSNPIKEKVDDLQKCKVSVKDFRVVGIRMNSIPPIPKVLLKGTLEVNNTGDRVVDINRFEFSVKIPVSQSEWYNLADVRSTKTYQIPPKQKELIDLDIESEFESLNKINILEMAGKLTQVMLLKGEAEFRLQGWFELATPLGLLKLPFFHSMKSKIRI